MHPNKTIEQIKTFANEICNTLGIPCPKILLSKLPSDMFAAYEPYEYAIYIDPKKCYDNKGRIKIEFFIAVSHELRHAYQYKNNLSCIAEYKERKYFDNTESYNLQPAEIDANAFAEIVIVDYFGLQVLWQNYSQKVRNEISNRVSQIAKELN